MTRLRRGETPALISKSKRELYIAIVQSKSRSVAWFGILLAPGEGKHQ